MDASKLECVDSCVHMCVCVSVYRFHLVDNQLLSHCQVRSKENLGFSEWHYPTETPLWSLVSLGRVRPSVTILSAHLSKAALDNIS